MKRSKAHLCTNVYKYVKVELRNFIGLHFQEENRKTHSEFKCGVFLYKIFMTK